MQDYGNTLYEVEVSNNFREQFSEIDKCAKQGSLSKSQIKFCKKYFHAILNLMTDPHNQSSLRTHEIEQLSKIFTKLRNKPTKVYQSYIENKSSSAKRIYWIIEGRTLTILGIAKHPKSSRETPKFKKIKETELLLKLSNQYFNN